MRKRQLSTAGALSVAALLGCVLWLLLPWRGAVIATLLLGLSVELVRPHSRTATRYALRMGKHFKRRQGRHSAPPQQPSAKRKTQAKGKSVGKIEQYIGWAEQRIGALIIAEKLDVGLVKVVQGPLTLTFVCRLIQPSQAALNRLLKLDGAMAQALQVEGVRISDTARGILIEVPSPLKRTPGAAQLSRYARGMVAPVGVDSFRQVVTVDLAQHGTLAAIGPSRRGKTQLVQSVAYNLKRANPDLLLYVVAFKRKDWQPFEGVAQVIHNPNDIAAFCDWLVEKLYREAASTTSDRLLVIFDDLINVLRVVDITDQLEQISSLGAGVGVHCILSTQAAGSKRTSGGTGTDASTTCRLLFKPSTTAQGARSAGKASAGLDMLSSAKGDCLLVEDGYETRIATPYVDGRDVVQLPGPAPVVGWLLQPVAATTAQPPTTALQPAATAYNHRQPPLTPPHVAAPLGKREGGTAEAVAAVATVAAWPIEKRPPTVDEARDIATLQAHGESLSGLCRRVYGFKDGQTFRWIKAAVQAAALEQPSGKAQLDMTTDEGAAAVDLLRAQGLWPRDTITEVYP